MKGIDCIFCRIAEGKAPANVVYKDDDVIAFLDIRPVNPGHTLVVPKSHHAYIWELPKEKAAQVFAVVHEIALAVREALKADGVRIVQLNGSAAGQEVFHFHVHVIPCYAGRTAKRRAATREELEQIARKICRYLKRLRGEP
ncbi:MAG: HIT family protein [Caldiserica bacterium]|nr:HIT family protein [Caldisericota bacterium]